MNLEDQKICAELWHTYEPQLCKICKYKMNKYPDYIDDIISEVYLALCKKISEFGVPEYPKAWLYGATNNLIAAKFKFIYTQREKIINIDEKEYELPYEYEFESVVHNNVILNDLIEFIDKNLNEDEKSLIKYIYIDELSMKEIANKSNSTPSAVKQKHYRLVKKIKKLKKNKNLNVTISVFIQLNI